MGWFILGAKILTSPPDAQYTWIMLSIGLPRYESAWVHYFVVYMGFIYLWILSMLSLDVTKYVQYPFTMDNSYPWMLSIGFMDA